MSGGVAPELPPIDPIAGFLRLTRIAQTTFNVVSLVLLAGIVPTILVIVVDRGVITMPCVERWLVHPMRWIRGDRRHVAHAPPPDERNGGGER